MNDLIRLFTQAAGKADQRNTFPAKLGDGAGNVKVTGDGARMGYMYARIQEPSEFAGVREVYNISTQPIHDLDVWVKKNGNGNLEVTGVAEFGSYYMGAGHGTANVGIHAAQHTLYGTDPLVLDPRLFGLPTSLDSKTQGNGLGRVYPSDPPDLYVQIGSFVYTKLDGTIGVYTGGSLDLTAYVPAGLGYQVYGIVYFDYETETPGFLSGSESYVFGSNPYAMPFTETNLAALTLTDPAHTPRAAVRLYYGQTAIDRYDIYSDIRPLAGWDTRWPSGNASDLPAAPRGDGDIFVTFDTRKIYIGKDGVWYEYAGTTVEGGWDVDTPPSSPGALDDEFNDASFTGWTEFDSGSIQTPTEASGYLRLAVGSQASRIMTGVYKTLPANPAWTIEAKIRCNLASASGSAEWQVGLALWENAATDVNDARLYGYGATSSGTGFGTGYWVANNNMTSMLLSGEGYTANEYRYVRLTTDGTYYYIDRSDDGESWTRDDVTTSATAFTIGQVGLALYNYGTSSTINFDADFFRYRAEYADIGEPVHGRGLTYVERGGDTMTGTLEIDVATTTEEALILKTTDDNTTKKVLEVRRSSGTAYVTIDADMQALLTASAAAKTPLALKGAASQSEPLLKLIHSSGTVFLGGYADGSVNAGQGTYSANNFWQINKGYNHTSGNRFLLLADTTWVGSATSSGGLYAVSGFNKFQSNNNLLALFGLYYSVRFVGGYGGDVTYSTAALGILSSDATSTSEIINGSAVRGIIDYRGQQTSSSTHAVAIEAQVSIAGAPTNAYGLYISQWSIAGTYGTPTNGYGIKIVDVAGCSSTNYAIYTGAGAVRFGDKVMFTQTDGDEYIDSLADGYMDYGATTAHRFDANVNVTGMVRQTATWHAFGGFQDESETISIDADTWTFVTNAGNDLWTGLEADGMSVTDDELIITNAGDYVGTLSLTFEGDNTKDYLFRVYNITQATQSGYKIGATGLGSNNYSNVCVPLYLEAAAADHFRFEVYQSTGSDAVVKNAIFHLAYLHD